MQCRSAKSFRWFDVFPPSPRPLFAVLGFLASVLSLAPSVVILKAIPATAPHRSSVRLSDHPAYQPTDQPTNSATLPKFNQTEEEHTSWSAPCPDLPRQPTWAFQNCVHRPTTTAARSILSYTFGNDVSDTVTLELSCSLDSVSRELARYLLTLLVRRDFREIVA